MKESIDYSAWLPESLDQCLGLDFLKKNMQLLKKRFFRFAERTDRQQPVASALQVVI